MSEDLANGEKAIPTTDAQAQTSGMERRQERRGERVEVEARELHVEFSQPCRIGEAARRYAGFGGLRDLEVEPVEPLQTITVTARGLDVQQDPDYVGDGFRRRQQGSEDFRVVWEHRWSIVVASLGVRNALVCIFRVRSLWHAS